MSRHVATRGGMAFRIELPAPFTGEGEESFNSWILRFEVAVNVASPGLEKAKLLPARLSGPAFAYWQSLSETLKSDYEQVKKPVYSVWPRSVFGNIPNVHYGPPL